ncbi:MAG TPA: hypothetical protein VK578_19640 [Edaphobacter sp.]|nr:hypothetical protein [Edaphobacter sp.]
MRTILYCVLPWLISAGIATGQISEHSTIINDVAKMPKQMQDGTFNQASFEASVESAVDDPNLDFTKLNPLLERELKSSDVRVRRYAALVTSQLSPRRANSAEELGPIIQTIVASVDDNDRGVQLASIVAAAGLHPTVPDSVVIPLRNRFARSDVNNESYAILAGALTKVRPNDTATDAVIITFLRNAKLSDEVRTQAIGEIGAPNLSDSITGEIVEIFTTTDSEQVKMASLRASENIGPRALNLEKDHLMTIQSDQTKSPSLRHEASRALGMLGTH